ncbi:MAG: sigma-70 family RNA polymerase sigma factor [Acidobacteriota bacterium]
MDAPADLPASSASDALAPAITEVLHAWEMGDEAALGQLMVLVCDDLRRMARQQMQREHAGHTLQPTALVNEVFLRFHDRRRVQWDGREHFFGYAAQTMRRVLIDHARGRNASKRGDGQRPLALDEALHVAAAQNVDLEALGEALDSLDDLDPRQARIVELRFFVGLTHEEIAAALEISIATVKREWRMAKAWLYRALRD